MLKGGQDGQETGSRGAERRRKHLAAWLLQEAWWLGAGRRAGVGGDWAGVGGAVYDAVS